MTGVNCSSVQPVETNCVWLFWHTELCNASLRGEVVRMRVSTSKSEATVLSWKTEDHSLWVGSELLTKECKHLGILFMS